MIRAATISSCGTYRMDLIRAADRTDVPTVAFVLNNPSTGDGLEDDATIRRGWGFAISWGYEAMVFVNVNPFRSRDPKHAKIPPEYALEANDHYLDAVMQSCSLVVCGWGDAADPGLVSRAVHLMHPLGPLHALGVTKRGNPRHPLYLPAKLKPELWRPEKWMH